ncbi:hypothetical protein ACIREO_28645 [Streptomyces sp. NPDC102441]|uniref:hypothetical protein n=1 Tax=Streptomyces sp. NPDC102441 TaxID=3366176 RepID=UPI00382F9D6C
MLSQSLSARQWLAEHGVSEAGDGQWSDAGQPGSLLTPDEVAHSWAEEAFTDGRLDRADQTRLAFGLLDLLDEYWVTCEIRFADKGRAGTAAC